MRREHERDGSGGRRGRAYAAVLDRLLIAAFTLGIGVPAGLTIVAPSTSSITSEFRAPPRFPEIALRRTALHAFPERFDAWFKDAFWSRPTLIRWHNAIELLGLGVSPQRTIDVGRNGWIFLAGESYVDCTRGTNPFSDADLDRWVDALATCDAWCRARGMHFLFLVAPNKATVYPEEAPARYARVGPTRMDQLFAALAARTQVEILDLRPVLAEAKRKSPIELYYPFGTHWNGLGAAAAYVALVGWIGERFPGVTPLAIEELSLDVKAGGDSWATKLYLGGLLNQRNPIVRHPARAMLVQKPLSWVPSTPGRGNAAVFGPDSDAPRLLFAHDSFGPWLADLLAPHCSSFLSVWARDIPIDVIERTKPDVVVFEMVERMLFQRPPDPSFRMLDE